MTMLSLSPPSRISSSSSSFTNGLARSRPFMVGTSTIRNWRPIRASMSSSSSSSSSSNAALVVVGSANADIYLEIQRLPKEGETIAAIAGQTLPGGKGANQAACAARLAHPTFFVGQVGKDANGSFLQDALASCGVKLDYMNIVPDPTGHAVVMLQPGGQNSIIIVGGANVEWPVLEEDGAGRLSAGAKQLIRSAGVILLQREVPDSVNIEAAQIAKNANVPVILDAGGTEGPIPDELLRSVTVFSPNETELARLTGMTTTTSEDIIRAAKECQKMGVKQVLVKLGEQGSLLLDEGGGLYLQPAIPALKVLDTTGAGDTFTAAYGVALVERQSTSDALKFAGNGNVLVWENGTYLDSYFGDVLFPHTEAIPFPAAAASLCVQQKGAIPSMPERGAVEKLLKERTTYVKPVL